MQFHLLYKQLIIGLFTTFVWTTAALAAGDAGIPYVTWGVHPNFNTSVVAVSPTTQYIYSTIDGTLPNGYHAGEVYLNIRTCMSIPCDPQWSFWLSQAVISMPGTSVALGDVLFDSSAPFRNKNDMTAYKWLMYTIVQRTECDGYVGGFLYTSFSQDGIAWTQPVQATRIGGPSFACAGGAVQTIPVAAFGAVYDKSSQTIFAVGLEGNLPLLQQPANYVHTMSYLGSFSSNDPQTGTILGSVSDLGIETTNQPSCSSYRLLVDLGIAYDALLGDLYLTRAYPFPHDILQPYPATPNQLFVACETPSCVDGVNLTVTTWGPGIQAWVNRAQLYRMHIGSLSNISAITSGTWLRAYDFGNATGYRVRTGGCAGGGACEFAPLMGSQESIGHDVTSLTIRRNGVGALDRIYDSGQGKVEMFFGSGHLSQTTGTSGCQITGAETVYVDTRPIEGQAEVGGYVDYADCDWIAGWAWDSRLPNTPIGVNLFEGSTRIGTFVADAFRGDLLAAGLGTGYHAFWIATPPNLKDGYSHAIRLQIAGTNWDLVNGARTFGCGLPISVVSGSYGANLGGAGNVTADLIANCNGRLVCDYPVRYWVIGDPFPGYAKNYVATWKCGESNVLHAVEVPAEAGLGSIARLSCSP